MRHDGTRELLAQVTAALNVALAYAEGRVESTDAERSEELAGCHEALAEARWELLSDAERAAELASIDRHLSDREGQR